MQPHIIIDYNQVSIEGVTIPRPSNLSPSQWLEFWQAAVAVRDVDDDLAKAEDELKTANERIKELERELADIKALAPSSPTTRKP